MKKTLFTLMLALFFISPEILRADNFSVGGIAISRPNYEGADEKELDILPLVDISIGKSFFVNFDGFSNSERGFGAYFLKNRVLELGGSFGYYESRNEEDDDTLKGIGDISSGIDGRIFAKIHLADYSVFAQIRNDLSNNHNGTLYILGADYLHKPSSHTNWRFKSGLTFADDNYMRSYFGITDAQRIASGPAFGTFRLNTFKAGSGFKDLSLDWVYNVDISRQWGLKGVVGYKFLVGDAANSPVVESRSQATFGVGLVYKFSPRTFKISRRAFNHSRY
jgi:MipA family protein